MFATHNLLKSAFAVTVGIVAAVPVAPALAGSDPLSSWRETAPKAALIDFVKKVTTEGSPQFVPIPERIAVFDDDGTLRVEQPIPAQYAFELDCVHLVQFKHPEWPTTQPFKAALERDIKTLADGGERSFAQILVATHAGWSADDYDTVLSGWLASTPHERFKRPYNELVYQPMLELLAYLRANDFETFIVSDGEIEFLRPWMEAVYGVPPQRAIGSSIKTQFEVVAGTPQFTRVPELNFIDDKSGKPIGIFERVGRRPILAFGNSDGDFEMLQWTTMAEGPHLGMIVHHTDAAREYAYDRGADFGSLDKALDAAAANGWSVIDMKRDWKAIFSPEKH